VNKSTGKRTDSFPGYARVVFPNCLSNLIFFKARGVFRLRNVNIVGFLLFI
jgi:hypothetical protein